MNSRELSERLEQLADKLEDVAGDWDKTMLVAEEVRALSQETYAPGNSLSWQAVAPPKKKTHTQKGKRTPF